ncbi:MAG TPA: hypothetical protein VMM15_41055, partial [Bradyrhizobium sp.]|nr:hypothetical protein [Bradyrhizobium sp.]
SNGAGAEDNLPINPNLEFLPALIEFDGDCPFMLEENSVRCNAAAHIKVRPSGLSLDIGIVGTRSIAVVDIHIEPAKAFLLLAVHVIRERVACLTTRLEKYFVKQVKMVLTSNPNGTVTSAVGRTAFGAALHALEIW